MRFILLGTLLFINVQGFSDYTFECDSGYKIATIKRDAAQGKKVGVLTVECEELPGAPATTCTSPQGPLACDGNEEECKDGFLGGLYGFELDTTTGAVLFQPICCTSSGVQIDTASCKGRRLNAIRSAFSVELQEDQVFTSFKCWKQYDLNNVIHDFIWKPNVCSIGGGGGNGGSEDGGDGDYDYGNEVPEEAKCDVCQCTCGPFTCPDNRRTVRLVHKRRKRGTTCQCICDCDYKCV